jgi:hypothetical protein
MSCRTPIALAALLALAIASGAAASERQRLDLDLDPAEVEKWDAKPPPHDLVIAAPAERYSREPKADEPGWSLRPMVDVDVGRDGEAEMGADADGRGLEIGDLLIDLNSVGVRLQQSW